jgi:general secretion pathway protein D
MPQSIHLRVPRRIWPATAALCCLALARMATAQADATTTAVAEGTQGKHHVSAAQDAYAAGAKRLDHGDLAGAERDFTRALQLDPGNIDYTVAITVAREHRLTDLVQQAAKARLSGDPAHADTLLAEARAIDPQNPMVLEHKQQTTPAPQDLPITPLTDRARMLSAGDVREPWKRPQVALAGALELHPSDEKKSFHLRGDARDVLRDIAAAYGIRTVFDDSVEHRSLRFDIEDVSYKPAMAIAMSMSHTFAVTIDETSVMIAKDDAGNRARLERLMEQTIFLPGLTLEQVTEIGNVLRIIFQIKEVVVQTGMGSIAIRAPEDILGPMNRTIQQLVDGNGEVMLDVKLYEISTTRMRNIGFTIPTQAGIYNVDATAASIVSQNQTLVQQAIAQGFVSATATNIEIALALLGSGLVQNSLLASTVGFFGGGVTKTGVTANVNSTFTLAYNSSDVRMLDAVQMQVGDRQPGTFRSGTKYPIVTSTYSTGLSAAPSALGNASINGVSVASLLSQFAGGTSATVPQVTYEDLGFTLKATPVMEKAGSINLTLDLKIEALAGGMLNGNPILNSRQFASDITVGDGESAMMVSNLSRSETAAVAGIPGLSELPGFQAPIDQNAEKDSGQLIVLVTPHIVRRRSNMVVGPRMVIRALDTPAGASN